MLFTRLRRLLSARNAPRHSYPPRPRHLQLELLEARTVPATTLTWTGAGKDNLWSDAANWTHEGAHKTPHDGDTVIFPDGAKQFRNQNDIPDLTLASVNFTGAGYDIVGQDINLRGGITTAPTFSVPSVDTIEFAITLTKSQSFTVGTNLTLALNGGLGRVIGSLSLTGTGTVQLGGISSIRSGGTIDVTPGSTLVVAPGATLADLGNLTVEHNATLIDTGTVNVGDKNSAGTLSDHGTVQVDHGGQLGVGGTLTVETDGRLDVTNGGAVGVGGKNAAHHIDDHGTITVDAESQLEVEGRLTVETDGTLTDAGSIGVSTAKSPGYLDDRHQVTILPGGTLRDDTRVEIESGATLMNEGTLSVLPGQYLNVDHGGILDDGGSINVDGTLDSRGTLRVEPGRVLNIGGTGTLANSDPQEPSALVATLTNKTPAIVLTTGVLNLTTTGGTVLDPANTELDLSTDPDLVPAPGDPFTLVTNTSGHPVRGHFQDAGGKVLNEGDTVHVGDFDFTISYNGGGSGMDIVLMNIAKGPKTFDVAITNGLSMPLTLTSAEGVPVTLAAHVSLAAGLYVLADPNNPTARVPFTVTVDGNVSYGSELEGVLGGNGTQSLFVNGRTMTIDVGSLSAPSALLDGTLSVANGPDEKPFRFTGLPGTYRLSDPGNTASFVDFSLTGSGAVRFDPSLQGILSVTGEKSSDLTVWGARVSIVATSLASVTTSFSVNGRSYPVSASGGMTTIVLLPGTFSIQYPVGNAETILDINLSPDDKVSFDPSLNAFVGLQGANILFLRLPAAPR